MFSFDPFAQWNKGFEMMTKMQTEAMSRVVSLYGEVEKLETKGAERGAVAIDEMSVIGKETLAYSFQLASEWRRLSLEAFKSFSPKA